PDYSPWLWIWRDPCIPIDGGRSPLKMQEILKYTRKVHPAPSTRSRLCELPHHRKRGVDATSHRGPMIRVRSAMQMQQIRYFLALCEERNFTRAARRCGVSQPSLTNAMIALERELGGALFQRRPEIVLTVLGH